MKKKNVSVFENCGGNSAGNHGRNAHLFGPTSAQLFGQNIGFFESRLLNQTGTPPDGAERQSATPEVATPAHKNAVEIIKAVHDLNKVGSPDVDDIPGSENPEDILKANPFKDALYSISPFCTVPASDLSLNGATDDRAKGVFTLKFSQGSAMDKFEIPGDAYIALMWQKIGPLVKERFARQITNPETLNAVITKAAEVKKPNFMAMVRAMATSANPDQIDMKLVTDALIELQALEKGALPKLRTATELKELKGSEGFKETNEQFEKINEIREAMNNLQTDMSANLIYWRMSIAGRSEEIDPKRAWKLSSDADIAVIKKDWLAMGIYDQNKEGFVDGTIFKNLRKAFDTNFLNKQPDYKKIIYNDPLNHLDELDKLGDQAFAMSVQFFVKVKEIGERHDQYRKDHTETHQGYGEEPITATLGKALRDNGKAFMDALHDKDWTTAGAYVLGVWAMYRAYKSLPQDKQDTYSKWAFRGAAIYAAHIFAKNAGYNVLEKLGIKDLGYELAGTSLDVLYEVLPELKNVPPRVINATAMTNIGDLYSEYKKTNGGDKRQWIDPAKFRTEFPEFARMRSNDAFKDGTLDSKQKDYKDTGHQLYLLTRGLEDAYNRIMRPHDVKGFMPFEEAVLKHPIYSKSTILDFTIALRNYRINTKQSIKLMGSHETGKLRERLGPFLLKQEMGVNIGGMRDTGVIDGTIMNFPVVFIRDQVGKKIVVVPKHLYEEGKSNFPDMDPRILGSFPLDDLEKDDASFSSLSVAAANEIKAKLTKSMEDRVKIFHDNGGFLVNPHWSIRNGRWEAKMSFKRMLPDGAIEQPIDVYVTPTDDGKGMVVRSTDKANTLIIHIKNLEDMHDVLGSIMLSKLVRQRSTGAGIPDFSPLSWFHQNGQLDFHDEKPDDDIIEIKIANVSIGGEEFIKIRQKKGVFTFVEKDMETTLLQNPNFQLGLSNAIGKTEFAETIEEWNKQIDATPQEYLFHFAGLFPNIFKQGSWDYPLAGFDGKFLTGSIPNKFTKALVSAQLTSINSKFMLGMEKARSFEDINKLRSSVIVPGKAAMANALQELVKLNQKNKQEKEKFSEAEFYAVWESLIGAGHKSADYKGFYRAFMDKVFAHYGISDFSQIDATRAGRLLEVFSYFTAPADDPTMDGAKLNFKLRITDAMDKHIGIITTLDEKLKHAATYAELLVEHPPAAGGAPGVSSVMTQAEFDAARKVMPEVEKLNKYNKNASFCGEVAHVIMQRVMREGDGWMPDGPGTHWKEMPDYKSWVATQINGANELVDSTPMLKMSDSYMTFDKWLELSRTNPTEAAKYDEKNIYLQRRMPERGITFTIQNSAERDMFKKVCTAHADAINAGKEPLMTQLEGIYIKRIRDIADKVRTEYNGKMGKSAVNEYAFNAKILELMTMDFDAQRITPANSYPMEVHLQPKAGVVDPDPSKCIPGSIMAFHIAQIEMSLSSSHRTMTGRDQNALIDAHIRQWFDENILNESVFDMYFDRKSVPKAIGQWFKDVKVFLFGW